MSGGGYYGFRVLRGNERRHLIDQVAFGYAEFELEYAGQRTEPFGRRQFVVAIPMRYRKGGEGYDRDQLTIHVSDAMVTEATRRIGYWKRAIQETSDEGARDG